MSSSVKRVLVVVLAVVAAFAVSVSRLHAQQTSINCDTKEHGLQRQINSAADAEIFVIGTCEGPLRITRNFTLTGPATLSAPGSESVLLISGAAVELRGLTVDGSGANVAIKVASGSVSLNNVTVRNASTAGVFVGDTSFADIRQSTINSNGVGVFVTKSSSANVVENTIHNNSGSGIAIDLNSSAKVRGNKIKNNKNGLWVTTMSSVTIGGNTIKNNSAKGVWVGQQYAYVGTLGPPNTIQNNKVDVECGNRGIFESPLAQKSTTKTVAITGGCAVLGRMF